VVGSANMDLVVRVPRFPSAGETLIAIDTQYFPGGKGANQATAIGRLGGNVALLAKVGDDAFGHSLIDRLQSNGVDISAISIERTEPTGVAVINVDDQGENTIVVSAGANARLGADDVSHHMPGLFATAVLIQNEIPLAAIRQAAEDPALTIYNPAPAAQLPADVYPLFDWITPNESETFILTGIRPVDVDSCIAAATALLDRGVSNVALTLGARGSFYASEGLATMVPTIEVNAIDTTAAGDAFNGALAHFLTTGLRPVEAVRLANCAGALATTKFGAQSSMPTLQEVMEAAGSP
jgi:ribokinase